MFSTPSRVLFISWLLLGVGTAPLDPPFDACGPKTPGPGAPQDSCYSSPPTVESEASFGVIGSSDGDNHQYDWTTCNPVLNLICDQMFAPNFTTNTWFFQTGPSKDAKGSPSAPCQMGFWISNTAGAAGRPGTITNVNRTMNATNPQRQCKNIFQTMLNTAASQVPDSIGSSINLQQNPATAKGQFKLPGGSGTGQAVDPGYPSYVLAFDTTWSAPADEKPGYESKLCQDVASGSTCICGSTPSCHKPFDSGTSPPSNHCVDTDSKSLCTCDSTVTCSEPIEPMYSDSLNEPKSCVDLTTGKACTCGSSKTCSSPGSGNQVQPSCHDSTSNLPCQCGSANCVPGVAGYPNPKESTCTDSQTGQTCTCGSSNTCVPRAAQPPPEEYGGPCTDSQNGELCPCGSSQTCTNASRSECHYMMSKQPCECGSTSKSDHCVPGAATEPASFSCRDSRTGEACSCGSSQACGHPSPPVPLCNDLKTGAPCACGSSDTCVPGAH